MMKILGDNKPFTAVTDWIDRLCSPKYAEDEYEGIPELVEAINLQQTGPTEASRAIRKKLKYGNLPAQKRALTILNALVENCNDRFKRTFADAMLVERIKIMSQDSLVDLSVRKKLMRILYGWYRQFKDDPSMRTAAGLYVACGGGRKSEQQLKSEASDAYRRELQRAEKERQIRADYKAAKRLQEEEQKKAKNKRGNRSGSQRAPFDLNKEKPNIQNCVASTQQYATALVNALQHVNREKESVMVNTRVQDYLAKVKLERKKIVRYIQLVKDEEYLGTLIAANDQILLALELYDKLAKPTDVDSDEDEPLAAIASVSAADKQARLDAEDAEIEAVRKRLLQARVMEMPDGELEKLQDRQRRGIERHRSVRAAGSSSSGGGGAMNDLMDLNFDDASRENLPPSIQPSSSGVRASSSTYSTSSAGARVGGGLSDYSDYGSDEDEEEEDDDRQSEIAVATAGTTGAATAGKGKQAIEEDVDDSASFASHRPRIGPRYASTIYSQYGQPSDAGGNKDDAEGEEDYDPFADPDDDDDGADAESFDAERFRASGPRETYAAV